MDACYRRKRIHFLGRGGGVRPTSTAIALPPLIVRSLCSSFSSHLSRALKVLSVYSVFICFVLLRCVAAFGRFRVCLVSAVIHCRRHRRRLWLCCPKRFFVGFLPFGEGDGFLSVVFRPSPALPPPLRGISRFQR